MAKVLVFKPGSVGDAEKRALLEAGIVPIETADPSSVRLLEPEGDQIAGGDLLFAALHGLSYDGTARVKFADKVLELVRESREVKVRPPARNAQGRFVKPSA